MKIIKNPLQALLFLNCPHCKGEISVQVHKKGYVVSKYNKGEIIHNEV